MKIGLEEWAAINDRRAELSHKKNQIGLDEWEQKQLDKLNYYVDQEFLKKYFIPKFDWEDMFLRILKPTPITSKKEMYQRLFAGKLGHTLPYWTTSKSFSEYVTAEMAKDISFCLKEFAVRTTKAHSTCIFNLKYPDVFKTIYEMEPGTYNITPILNDKNRICYAHLYADSTEGWFLHYTEDSKPARLLYSKDGCVQKWRFRTSAREYLRTIMSDVAWFTLNRLINDYPEHCIEFSVMSDSIEAQDPNGSNTIFWEVRCLTGEYERDSFKPQEKSW